MPPATSAYPILSSFGLVLFTLSFIIRTLLSQVGAYIQYLVGTHPSFKILPSHQLHIWEVVSVNGLDFIPPALRRPFRSHAYPPTVYGRLGPPYWRERGGTVHPLFLYETGMCILISLEDGSVTGTGLRPWIDIIRYFYDIRPLYATYLTRGYHHSIITLHPPTFSIPPQLRIPFPSPHKFMGPWHFNRHGNIVLNEDPNLLIPQPRNSQDTIESFVTPSLIRFASGPPPTSPTSSSPIRDSWSSDVPTLPSYATRGSCGSELDTVASESPIYTAIPLPAVTRAWRTQNRLADSRALPRHSI